MFGLKCPRWSWLYSMRRVGRRGGPGGGVASWIVTCSNILIINNVISIIMIIIVTWMRPITVTMTTSEMKIPFQSLDLVGMETSSCTQHTGYYGVEKAPRSA